MIVHTEVANRTVTIHEVKAGETYMRRAHKSGEQNDGRYEVKPVFFEVRCYVGKNKKTVGRYWQLEIAKLYAGQFSKA